MEEEEEDNGEKHINSCGTNQSHAIIKEPALTIASWPSDFGK